MNKKIHIRAGLLAVLLAAFLMQAAQAQVTVESRIDSAQIFIGQRVGITLEVSADAGASIQLPLYDSLQQIVPGVEVQSVSEADSNFLNDGKRIQLTRRYYVTSFDSALYYLPPFKVKVNGQEYETKNLALKVYTLDVDTLHEDSFFGMKPAMSPPFAWSDYRSLFLMSVLVLILTLLLIYVAVRLKENKPIVRRIKQKKKLPPHQKAMQEIERIKEEKIWQQEDSKEYYTALTDTLRQYMVERYGFNAMEMTTPEIIAHLQEVNDEAALAELRELFMTADLVKFAKYSTLINENDRNLVNAIDYINSTKVEEKEAPQPEEVVIVDKRSKKTKLWLTLGISVAAILLLLLVVQMVIRIVQLSY